MKRKQLIKQLMAEGIQRNTAAQVAGICTARGLSLFKGLGLYLNTYAMMLHGQDPAILYRTQGGGQA